MSDIRKFVEVYSAFYRARTMSKTSRTLPLMEGINIILKSDHRISRDDLKALLTANSLELAEDDSAATVQQAEAFSEMLLGWFEWYCKGRRDLLRRYRFVTVNAAAVAYFKQFS